MSSPTTVTEILSQAAREYATKPAMSMQIGFRTTTFTFSQLEALAKKTALFLLDHGVKKGDRVLICAPNSPYWIALFWGCLLIGAIAVPLNTQSTQESIASIAQETEALALFCLSGFKHTLNIATFYLDHLAELTQHYGARPLPATPHYPDDLVEILYTSGTTGQPKGVMLTHANLVANWAALQNLIPLLLHDRTLSILPLSHIYEQMIGFLLPFSHGAHIIYAHSQRAIQPLMKQWRITKMVAVPEFLELFMNRIETGVTKRGMKKLFDMLVRFSLWLKQPWFSRLLFWPLLRQFGGKLNTIASGGAPLSIALEKKWNALGIIILQGYGLTETAPTITTNTYDERKMGSVGKPIHTVAIHIDEQGQLWVKGPSVFLGYYRNSKKTQEVLTSDGWFNTEDIAEIDAEGFVYIKGRKKYMILGPGGQNIYPEDIEQKLNALPQFSDTCVIGLQDNGKAPPLHAIVLSKSTKEEIDNLITQVNEELASYQQITSWSVWPEEDFPRTPTKKIKKDIVIANLFAKKNEQPAQTTTVSSNKLINIIAQLTQKKAADITPNKKLVQDLGLDSLMRVELVTRVETELGKALPEQSIDKTTTVADLEALLDSSTLPKPIPPLPRWPRSWWAQIVRFILQLPLLLFARIFVRLRVKGLERLKQLWGPVIFMPNHISYGDPIIITMALPLPWRRQLAFAAARDMLYEQFGWIAPIGDLLLNSFPIQRADSANIRLGLEHIGAMLDQGYSVVMFPEGRIDPEFQLTPVKPGAGLAATQMSCPVVPVLITGVEKILPYEELLPQRRATVTVTFGEPLIFQKTDSHIEAAQKIFQALKRLEQEHKKG